jgi:uncharacterized protein YneF (UPF0154 family)
MSQVITIVSTMLAVGVGYALGIFHCKRAFRDAMAELERRRLDA